MATKRHERAQKNTRETVALDSEEPRLREARASEGMATKGAEGAEGAETEELDEARRSGRGVGDG